MRAKLLHPLRERSRELPERRGHERRAAQPRAAQPRVIVLDVEPAVTAGLTEERDLAVEQARRAGGPHDMAVYTCSCGYLFRAAVTTTVSCPHCGGDQAW